jgi:hypothetical protein
MSVAQRHLCMKSMHAALLQKRPGADPCDVQTDTVELEHAVFVTSKGKDVVYPLEALRALRILERGKKQWSQSRPRGAEGITPYVDVLRLTAVDLFDSLPCREAQLAEDAMRAQGEALLRDLSSPDLSNIPDAGTRCSKCRSSDISFDFLQTRSADEGTTVYCTCTSCGKRWKM